MLNWNIFDFVYFVVFMISFAIRWPHEKTNRLTRIIKANVDLTEKVGLLLAFMGGMFFPLLYLFTPAFDYFNYELSLLSGISGSILSILALWLFHRSHVDLGRQWSPKLEIRESHQLITNGIYKTIRHPMYTSIFIAATCQLLLVANWLIGPAYLIGFSVLFFSRVKREEALMLEEFGDEYVCYMSRTNRIFPKLFTSKET